MRAKRHRRIWQSAHNRCRFLREALEASKITSAWRRMPALERIRWRYNNTFGPEWMAASCDILDRLIVREIAKCDAKLAELGWANA